MKSADNRKTIAVIDGMGGKIGYEIAKRILGMYRDKTLLVVLGTNAIATMTMMKAGANRGATGENAIKTTIANVDMIVGPLSIVVTDSYMGEVSTGMAAAIARCPAEKILLPISNPYIHIVGVKETPLPHLMDEALEEIGKRLGFK